MNCSSLSEVSDLHDASDSPSAEISRLLNPSLSDDKTDQMSSDMGLDFGESSKFDPDSVLGSSYSLGREGDETDDLDLSITPNFETGLSCSPPSCFDNSSASSLSTATVPSLSRVNSSGLPAISVVSAGNANAGQILSSLSAGPVVIGNVTAESLVSAVLNAKKTESCQNGMNSVSVTPAAAGIWVLNTPPININPDILNLVKPVILTSSVQSAVTNSVQDVQASHIVEASKNLPFSDSTALHSVSVQPSSSLENNLMVQKSPSKDVIRLSVGTTPNRTTVTDAQNNSDSADGMCGLQDGTHMVLKSQDTNPTSFLRLEDILMKHTPVQSTPQKVSEPETSEKNSSKRLLLTKSDGSDSNSFSELFSFQDFSSNSDVTQTKELSDGLPLTNITSLGPDQPILQCSSSEEFQEVDEKPVTKEIANVGKATIMLPTKPSEIKKYNSPTLIIEGLQEGSKLVKALPSHKVPILPKDPIGEKGEKDQKVPMPVTCEEKSTPVLVHLIRNSEFQNKDILYCQNIQTTLTEDLGHDMTEDGLGSSSDEEGSGTRSGENFLPLPPQMAKVVPTQAQPQRKYQRHGNKNKVFKCDLCTATFETMGNYTRHRKIHKVDSLSTQFICGTCGRGFIQRCDMKRHMLIHTKQEPHKCPTCGKGYIRKSDLVVHLRFHNKERPYKCTQCEKQYFQSGDLKRHVRLSHTKECMLSCGHCKKQYATETTLIRHMQMQHRDIILMSLNQRLTEDSKEECNEASKIKTEAMETQS